MLIDTPGSRKYKRNWQTGAATADAAVLVISADADAESIGPWIKEQMLCMRSLGVVQWVCAVNMIDKIGYDEARYSDTVKVISQWFKKVGMKTDNIAFIPISGLLDQNIASKASD